MSESKTYILAAAGLLLNKHGLESVTIRNVAEESNYGRSTVTHHFHDKETLLDNLHIMALEAFASHIASSRFGPSYQAVDLEGQKRLRARLGADGPAESPPEPGISIYSRFRDCYPGYWRLLRFRQSPDFTESDAPTAWSLLMGACGGELDAPVGRTVDMIIHQLFALHDWVAEAKPEAVVRVLQAEPSVRYWLAVLEHKAPN